jgi:hypothetical protein
MRPNTPHFVVTPESAICHGGHFYAMSAIRDTVFGIYHMFVASKNITNTEHTQDAHLLLRRLVVYTHYVLVKNESRTTEPTVHIPNVSTFEGTLDLFMLCVIMELGDIIIPLAYKKKYRRDRDRDHDRLCTIHARGLARDLRKWWYAHYVLFDPEANRLVDGRIIFETLFSQQINSLIYYKKLAESKNIQGDELECTAEVLERLARKYFPHVLARPGLAKTGFEWDGIRYVVRVRRGVATSYTGPGKLSSFVKTAFFYNEASFTMKFKVGMSSLSGRLTSTRSLWRNT